MKWLSVCRLGCELDEEIVEFLVEVDLSLLQSIQTTSVTIQFLKLITDLLLGLRSGMYGALSPHTYVFVVWCLVSHRDRITIMIITAYYQPKHTAD